MNPRLRTTGLILFFASIMLGGFAFLTGYARIPSKNWAQARQIKDRVQKEVPFGADKSQVMAWLDAQKTIQYYYAGGEDVKYQSVVAHSRHRPDELGGVIRATLPKVAISFVTYWEVHLVFFFDKKGWLIDYSIKDQGLSF